MMFPTEVGLLAEDGSVVIKIKGDDSPFQKVLGKIGSAVSTAVKASAAAVGAASAGVAALGTACINAYADYEQLVGGVETLFKDSADTIQTYADNAYKTAGLSANESYGNRYELFGKPAAKSGRGYGKGGCGGRPCHYGYGR